MCRIAEQYLKKGSEGLSRRRVADAQVSRQGGQDRYSTEVVLQGFNSQLTMLDGRSGGGGASGDNGDDFGSAGVSGGGSRRQPAMAGGDGGRGGDLDDAIPF